MLLSRNAVSCDFDRDPTFCASTLPFLKSMSVGIRGYRTFSDFLVLVDVTLRLELTRVLLGDSSSTGAIALHGPHHSAQ